MELLNKNIVITGAASGIGEALARHFLRLKANVFLSDRNQKKLGFVAEKLGCAHHVCDVGKEEDILALVKQVNAVLGHIDLFCSNAGIFFKDEFISSELDNQYWTESWHINVMSHVYAARHVLPQMIQRRSGYFLQIISAAALLSQIGASAYSATKSAALSFAESLAISNGLNGIKVSAVCPQYVATPMLGFNDPKASRDINNLISPDEAALQIIDGVLQGKFLIVTDTDAIKFFERKCKDYDRWIAGMQSLRDKIIQEPGEINLGQMHKFI